MAKIKLTESQLHKVIKESVKRIITELDWKTYANASRKWADVLAKNPQDKRRKSDIIGHQNSYGTHDIPTDNRLRNFHSAMIDNFNDDYSFNQYRRDNKNGDYSMDWGPDDIGAQGYYDQIRTKTHTPSSIDDDPHSLEDKFYLDSIDGSNKYPSDKHKAIVSHINGNYNPNTQVKRDAVEPKYDNIPYMKARNKGNKEIQDYQNGKYEYKKGKGWELK